MKKVWFITGASKGLGLALVKKLLSEGYSVAATSRNSTDLQKEVGETDISKFLPLQVDLTSEARIKQSVDEAYQHFGKLDVLVNNAGYGIGGAIEELSSKEIGDSFDINVFAAIYSMQAVMPYFRQQRSGYIINISSIAGFAPATGWGIYAASKYAIIGLTEVMAEDVKELGIKATAVAPGAFRTSFLTDASLVYSANKIDDYKAVHATHQKYDAMDGKQAGDPDKAAALFIQLAESEEPPVRLFIGSDAYSRATIKTEYIMENLEANKALSYSTDFS